ncbi:hypothetical protein [Nocardia sp. NPDC002869]|uniref:hypothetical protein n=1 Tax=Nocardia sp. NPDC002869 TaxID=3161032 RepID=UPI00398D2116
MSITNSFGNSDVRVVASGESGATDISLLYCDSHLGSPVRCRDSGPAPEVWIRGAASGVDTSLVTMRARCAGTEYLDTRSYLDLIISDLGMLEHTSDTPSHEVSTAYQALRGLSGAPAATVTEGMPFVCGMVTRRNTAGIANHIYALRISDIAAFLRSKGYVLQISRRPVGPDSSLTMLTGRLISRLSSEPGGINHLWEDTSELFYSGVAMDELLREILAHPGRYALTDAIQLAGVRYLLARLLAKRGESSAATSMLAEARRTLPSSTGDRSQLSAAIDLRLTVQLLSAHGPDARHEHLAAAVGAFESVDSVPENYRAYEVASVLGGEATRVSCSAPFLDGDASTRRYFTRLRDRHSSLVADYPLDLTDKQEVVGIGLQALTHLFDVEDAAQGSARADVLAAVATSGKVAAIQRGNGIFMGQMRILEAIAFRYREDAENAYHLIATTAIALAGSDVGLQHEGIRAYLTYLDRYDPASARLLRAVHGLGVENSLAALRHDRIAFTTTDRDSAEHALQRLRRADAMEANLLSLLDEIG